MGFGPAQWGVENRFARLRPTDEAAEHPIAQAVPYRRGVMEGGGLR